MQFSSSLLFLGLAGGMLCSPIWPGPRGIDGNRRSGSDGYRYGPDLAPGANSTTDLGQFGLFYAAPVVDASGRVLLTLDNRVVCVEHSGGKCSGWSETAPGEAGVPAGTSPGKYDQVYFACPFTAPALTPDGLAVVLCRASTYNSSSFALALDGKTGALKGKRYLDGVDLSSFGSYTTYMVVTASGLVMFPFLGKDRESVALALLNSTTLDTAPLSSATLQGSSTRTLGKLELVPTSAPTLGYAATVCEATSSSKGMATQTRLWWVSLGPAGLAGGLNSLLLDIRCMSAYEVRLLGDGSSVVVAGASATNGQMTLVRAKLGANGVYTTVWSLSRSALGNVDPVSQVLFEPAPGVLAWWSNYDEVPYLVDLATGKGFTGESPRFSWALEMGGSFSQFFAKNGDLFTASVNSAVAVNPASASTLPFDMGLRAPGSGSPVTVSGSTVAQVPGLGHSVVLVSSQFTGPRVSVTIVTTFPTTPCSTFTTCAECTGSHPAIPVPCGWCPASSRGSGSAGTCMHLDQKCDTSVDTDSLLCGLHDRLTTSFNWKLMVGIAAPIAAIGAATAGFLLYRQQRHQRLQRLQVLGRDEHADRLIG